MRLSKRVQALLFCLAVPLTFCVGAGATACVMRPARSASPRMSGTTPADLVISYVEMHPDPAVSGPFAEKLRKGEIKIVVEKPKEHAMASFGLRGGVYVLTMDPARLKSEPTEAETEDVLSILSHEHAHYRQFVEEEMLNYYARDGKMTEAACTLTILVEIDAHAKACRDALAYGWESRVALSACERTTKSLAEYFLRERLATYPECQPIWGFFASHVPGKTRVESKTHPTKPSRKRSAPIYMPPP